MSGTAPKQHERSPLLAKDGTILPLDAPNSKRRNVHWFGLAFIILGEIAGQGTFTLPKQMSRLGWVLGTITCLGFVGLNALSLRVMHAMSTRVEGEGFTRTGDVATRLLGERGGKIARVVVQLYLFSLIAADLNAMGRSVMNFCFHTRVCMPVASALAVAMALPFAQLRAYGDITFIASLSLLALALCVLLLVFADDSGAHIVKTSTLLSPSNDVADVLTGIGGFFFAAGGGQCAFFEYLSEMETPADYLKTVSTTAPTLIALYYGTASYVYSKYGTGAPGFLLDILPFDGHRYAGNALFVFHLIVSFVILNAALLRGFVTRDVTDKSWSARAEWATMSVVVLGAAYVLCNSVNLIENLVGAIGALFQPVIVMCLPATYALVAMKGERGKRFPSESVRVALKCMIALGALLVPLLTAGALRTTIADAKDVAAPFSCGVCVTKACAAAAR